MGAAWGRELQCKEGISGHEKRAEARGRNDDNDAGRHSSRDQPGLMPSGAGTVCFGKGGCERRWGVG